MAYVTGGSEGAQVTGQGRMQMPNFDLSVLSNENDQAKMIQGVKFGLEMAQQKNNRIQELDMKAAQLKAAQAAANKASTDAAVSAHTASSQIDQVNASNYAGTEKGQQALAQLQATKETSLNTSVQEGKNAQVISEQIAKLQPDVFEAQATTARTNKLVAAGEEARTPKEQVNLDARVGVEEALLKQPAAFSLGPKGIVSKPASKQEVWGQAKLNPDTNQWEQQSSTGSYKTVTSPKLIPQQVKEEPVVKIEDNTAFGIPNSFNNPLASVPEKARSAIAVANEKENLKQLADIQKNLEKSESTMNKLGRFQELNAKTDTGPWINKVPGSVALSDNRQEMQAISSEIAPQMRVPGSGSSSDKDVAMFKAATVGLDKDKPVNDSIVNSYRSLLERERDRADFLNQYTARGATIAQAKNEWSKYANANPIFDPNAKDGELVRNPNYMPRSEYFSGKARAAGSYPIGEVREDHNGNQYKFDGKTWNKL